MTRMQTLACSACLIFVEVAAAAADTTTSAPRSLHMRARPPEAAYPSPMPRGKRVAQPTPDQPAGGDQPSASGTGNPPPPAADPTPATDQTGLGPDAPA